jgi:hypothetical protein
MAGLMPHERSMAERILENIIFIEEVFADRSEGEVPDVPVIELAKSFELSRRALIIPPEELASARIRRSRFQKGSRFQTGMTQKP